MLSKLAFLLSIISLGNRKLKFNLHLFITSMFADLNSFVRKLAAAKLRELLSAFDNERNVLLQSNMHLLFTVLLRNHTHVK